MSAPLGCPYVAGPACRDCDGGCWDEGVAIVCQPCRNGAHAQCPIFTCHCTHEGDALAALRALADLGAREQWPPDEWRAAIYRVTAEKGTTCTYYAGCTEPAGPCGYCETHCLCGVRPGRDLPPGGPDA